MELKQQLRLKVIQRPFQSSCGFLNYNDKINQVLPINMLGHFNWAMVSFQVFGFVLRIPLFQVILPNL